MMNVVVEISKKGQQVTEQAGPFLKMALAGYCLPGSSPFVKAWYRSKVFAWRKTVFREWRP
jgi:hypothetical protein